MQEVKEGQIREDENGIRWKVLGQDPHWPHAVGLVKLTGTFGLGAGWSKDKTIVAGWRLIEHGPSRHN